MDMINSDHNATYLNTNIRVLRKELRISQEELASRIGLNRGNIASYENGTAEPKICNLLKLAHLFGISIHHLTQSDLSKDDILQRVRSEDHSFLPAHHPTSLHTYLQRAKELEQVMNGLNTCCRYKLKRLGEQVPKDMQIVVMHFEELYDTAQALMKEHRSLLDYYHQQKK